MYGGNLIIFVKNTLLFMRKFGKETKKDNEQKNLKDKFSNKQQKIIK